MILSNRNNTSFTKELYESLKLISIDKSDFLRYHQRIVTEYIIKNPESRGILLYHQMGSGKTLLGVSICEELLKLKTGRKVIFISPKSLHENFRKDFRKYSVMNKSMHESEVESHIEKHYSFVSLNASNMLDQVKRSVSSSETGDSALMLSEDVKKRNSNNLFTNLNGCIIIWDEFHNFLNSVSNGSQNSIGLYDLVMQAEDIKLIGMTGTPIVNDPYEIAIAFNLLAGKIKSSKTIKGVPLHYSLFGEDYLDFVKNFVTSPDSLSLESKSSQSPGIKNKSKFQDRIFGLVSYYGADTTEFLKLFPVEYELIVTRVPMSQPQFSSYILARDRELEEVKRGVFNSERARLSKPTGASSSYRIRSRQFSNFVYPEYASKTYRDSAGRIKFTEYFDKLDEKAFNNLKTWSPKITELLKNVSMHLPPDTLAEWKYDSNKKESMIKQRTKNNSTALKKLGLQSYAFGIGPGLIYSQFKNFGVELLGMVLRHNKMQEVKNVKSITSEKNKHGTYAIISGDVDSVTRSELIAEFNKPENKNGSIISLLIITSTGAEGIDLKRGRHIHVLEPFWHWSRIMQVITRIVRLNSHIDLPETERSVQAYIYLSDYPGTVEKDKKTGIDAQKIQKMESTTDVSLFQRALQNQKLINEFLLAVKQSSIDCMIHYGPDSENPLNCRICSPTGKQLWYPNIDTDIENPSPCETYKSEKITTKSITWDNVEYKYTKNPETGTRIFTYKPELGGWLEIFEDHENYIDILQAINKK